MPLGCQCCMRSSCPFPLMPAVCCCFPGTDRPPLGCAFPLPAPRRVLAECQLDASEALRLQAAVGYGLEDTQMIIESMAQVGEGTGGRAAGR